MALVLYLDKVDGASISLDRDNSVYVRKGIIKGMRTTLLPASQIFMAATSVSGMPVYDSLLYAGSPFKLRQYVFETRPGVSDKVWVSLIYRTLGLAVPPVTFVLSRDTDLVATTSEYHPGTKKPIVVNMFNPTTTGTPPPGFSPVDNFKGRQIQVGVPYEYPVQRLIATGWYRDGPPPAAMINALGSVNDASWRGLDVGFWKYSHQSDVTQDYGGSFTITLGLTTKIRRDWSEWKFLRDELQNFVKPKPEDVAALDTTPYVYDQINKNKVTKVGMYPLADFGAIFGFGAIGMPY